MKDGPVYIYGRHAVEEAQAHMPQVLKKVMTDVTGEGHGGYVAIVDTTKLLVPYADFVATLTPTASTALVVLAGLNDPHNVGAIIRSAAAFGCTAVLIPTTNQAPVTSTVVKTSEGMVFRIPLITIGSIDDTLIDLKKRGFRTYGLAGKGATKLNAEVFDAPCAFVVGNEGVGMTAETESSCDALLAIPIHAHTESLNAAAAAAVVMYDWSTKHSESL